MDDNTSTVSIATVCPEGHTPTQVFDRGMLTEALRDKSVQFYCAMCDKSWTPPRGEQDNVSDWLESSAAS
jgi:hypothetical protein